MPTATCHPLLKYHAKGLCKSCYHKALWLKRHPIKPRLRSFPAICHPDKNAWNRGLCKTCYLRMWRHNKGKDYARAKWLRENYNISLADYNVMLQTQGGVCFLCNGLSDNGSLAVDHKHDTGELRKLLCRRCNTTIGIIEKLGPSWLKRVEKYLGLTS